MINKEGIEKFVVRNYIEFQQKVGYHETNYAYMGPPKKETQVKGWGP